MDNSVRKVVYFTNTYPTYRKELWQNLLRSRKIDFNIYFSEKSLDGIGMSSFTDLKDKDLIKKFFPLKNYKISGHIFYQYGVIKSLLNKKIDIAIFLGDFKLLSTWLGLLICNLKGIKTVLWTHGLYGNESIFKKKVRLIFFDFSDNLFLYENRAKKILIENNFNFNKLHVVYNSINLCEQKKVYSQISKPENSQIHKLVFFGRLTKIKRVDQAIKAVINLNRKKIKYNLTIVGDGVEKKHLVRIVKESNSDNFIFFEKAKYNEFEIGKLFINSELLISPGNVGLNAVHSICYGTPVLTHNNFSNQMPEAEIIKVGFNGLFHLENNINSISEKINEWFSLHYKKWDREVLRKSLSKNYDPVIQARTIENKLLEM